MKPEIRKRLVRRILASKKLAQGNLRIGNAFCPLGLLCDMYKRSTGRGKWRWDFGKSYDFVIDEDAEDGYPQRAVREWAGLSTDDAVAIWSMNDTNGPRKGKRIKEVAEFIEQRFGEKPNVS